MPLQHTDLEGTLEIDSFEMQNQFGAWGIVGDETGRGGLVHLWDKFDIRGQDRILPTATGVIPYPRRMTVTRCDLRLIVIGDIDGVTGTPNADPVAGLAINTEYIRAGILAPVVSSSGLRSAVLTVPGMANRTAFIHVLGTVTQSYQFGFCGSIAVKTLQISIPEGRFA